MTDAKPDESTHPTSDASGTPLLDVRNLRVTFRTDEGTVVAVDDLSFQVSRGETLGIVGESGSGKSVTQLATLGLLPTPPGTIERGEARFHGDDLLTMRDDELRALRGDRIGMIFQDPMTSLNPFLRIQRQLTEVLETHRDMSQSERVARAIDMLERVGIPDAAARIGSYPHQFSGGMRQRVMIAMALMCDPELLIADEPTTALDVTIQAQILDLLRELRDEFNSAIILITHDLGVVAGMADRILVMYAGAMMETAPTSTLFAEPAHPYTIGLLRSVPRLDQGGKSELIPIAGQPPDLANVPAGCPFADRCPFVIDVCREEFPETRNLGGGHSVRCHRPEVQRWHQEGHVAPPEDAAAAGGAG